MKTLCKIGHLGSQGQYLAIDDQNVINHLAKEFPGIFGEVLQALIKLEAPANIYCYLAFLKIIVVQENISYPVLEIGFLNCNHFQKGKFTLEEITYLHPNENFDLVWEEILVKIEKLISEIDRIGDIVQ